MDKGGDLLDPMDWIRGLFPQNGGKIKKYCLFEMDAAV